MKYVEFTWFLITYFQLDSSLFSDIRLQ